MAANPKKNPDTSQVGPMIFARFAGIFLFITLLKFGTPVILDNLVLPPESAIGAVYESWQLKWGYRFLLPLILVGLATMNWRALRFKWLLLLPLAWLGWQFISATQSINPALTRATVHYFAGCVVLFYLGYFCLQGARNPWPVWAGLGLGLCWVMRLGLEQHFGGLEATRHMLAQMNESGGIPPSVMNNPDYLRRIASDRIFSTFSSADAMAGCIELVLPLSLVWLWQLTPKVRLQIRWTFVAILGGCGLACLYWTGSKGGWAISLLLGILAVSRSAISAKSKWIIFGVIIVMGAAAFGIQYKSSSKKQAASVTTRVAYWRGALAITAKHPLLGTGPGTFSTAYRDLHQSTPNPENPEVSPPKSDFARLAHNDYLEQACDSGLPASIFYFLMIFLGLSCLYRYRVKKENGFSQGFAVWLGLLGLCLHSFVDYHLYIPSLAWPMFLLLGFGANFQD